MCSARRHVRFAPEFGDLANSVGDLRFNLQGGLPISTPPAPAPVRDPASTFLTPLGVAIEEQFSWINIRPFNNLVYVVLGPYRDYVHLLRPFFTNREPYFIPGTVHGIK